MGADAPVGTPVDELAEAWHLPRGGPRRTALREAADAFRRRFRAGPAVLAVRTLDLAAGELPVRAALGDGARSLSGRCTVRHRAVLVRYADAAGAPRTLVWEPVPAFEAAGGTTTVRRRLSDALGAVGVDGADVDIAGFAHLQGISLPATLVGPGAALPRACAAVQRRELDLAREPHPVEACWYAASEPDAGADRLLPVAGDVELAPGVALVRSPVRSAGQQSLVLNTGAGVWVVSGAGLAVDSWQPHLSKLPAVRRRADDDDWEVVPCTLGAGDPGDGYDALLVERSLADADREDPRWRAILPVPELMPSRRGWPVQPTFTLGGLDLGSLTAAPSGAGAARA